MAQITIYLPHDLEVAVRSAAESAQQSVSRWIAERLASHLDQSWPREALDAAGAFPDFPSLESLRKGYGEELI